VETVRKEIKDDTGILMAVIVGYDCEDQDGIQFFTKEEDLQIGFMVHPQGHEVIPHKHKKVQRSINGTTEVLIVVTGSIELLLYGTTEVIVEEVKAGQAAMLINGGHSIRAIEDAKIWEVKQGPYLGQDDKEYIEV